MKLILKIIKHSIKNNHKLLGICYGAEILHLLLGGTIKKQILYKKEMKQYLHFQRKFYFKSGIERF